MSTSSTIKRCWVSAAQVFEVFVNTGFADFAFDLVPETIYCLRPLVHSARPWFHLVDARGNVHMEHFYEEMTQQLAGGTDVMNDAGEISGRMVERLHGIIIAARIHHLRIALHRFEILFAHLPMLVEVLESGEITPRPPLIATDALDLHIPWCADHEITPVHNNCCHCRFDLGTVVLCLLELFFAVRIV